MNRNPVVRVPVERDSADLLPAAIDPASYALRDAGRGRWLLRNRTVL